MPHLPGKNQEKMLKQATDEKWQVDEVKCLANGDDYCEFSCRKV